MDCGVRHPYYVMQFDHREGEKKFCDIASLGLGGTTASVLLGEIAKCDVVCANCHRERTHRRARAPLVLLPAMGKAG
jgi:hypothetical protein